MENTGTRSAVWQHEKGLLRIGPRCHCRYTILSEIITFLMRFAYMLGGLVPNWKIAPAQIPSIR